MEWPDAALRPGRGALFRALLTAALLMVSACGGTRGPAPPPPAATAPAPSVQLRQEVELPAAAAPAGAPEPAGEEGGPLAEPAVDPEYNVFFLPGGAEVDEAGKALLQRHALRLKQDPAVAVILAGFTDPRGSRSYNLALAEARIDAVAAVLRAAGVQRHRIRRANAGHRTPVRDCGTPACRRAMRRVELVYEK